MAQALRVVASAAAPEPSKAQRQLWFPGNKAPEYLDGSLPGDFGFDPLGLGSDPQTLRWCVVPLHLYHCTLVHPACLQVPPSCPPAER